MDAQLNLTMCNFVCNYLGNFYFLKFFNFFEEGVFAPYNCGVVYSPPPRPVLAVCGACLVVCGVFYFVYCSFDIIKRIEKQKVTTKRKAKKREKKQSNTKRNKISVFAAN